MDITVERMAELQADPSTATHAEAMALADADSPIGAMPVSSADDGGAAAGATGAPAADAITAAVTVGATGATGVVDAGATGATGPAEPDGATIASKSGTAPPIPFGVLKHNREMLASEKQARADAEARVAELTRRTQELEAAVAAGKTGDGGGAQAAATAAKLPVMLTEDELAVMREDFPAQAKMYEALMAQTQSLQEKVQAMQQLESNRIVQEKTRTANEVQDRIDANPKLAYLQLTNPEAWQSIAALDDHFKTQAATKGLSMDERFNRVVAAYEGAYGPIQVPADFLTDTTIQAAKPQATEADIRAQALKVLEGKKPAVPTSLSSLPGGAPAAQSEVQALEQMSAGQLGKLFEGKTQEQIDAYLNQHVA